MLVSYAFCTTQRWRHNCYYILMHTSHYANFLHSKEFFQVQNKFKQYANIFAQKNQTLEANCLVVKGRRRLFVFERGFVQWTTLEGSNKLGSLWERIKFYYFCLKVVVHTVTIQLTMKIICVVYVTLMTCINYQVVCIAARPYFNKEFYIICLIG